MAGTINDGFTEHLVSIMNEYQKEIYEIEDYILSRNCDFVRTHTEIIEYLNNRRFSATLGMGLRRYLCGRFCQNIDEAAPALTLELDNGERYEVKNYMADDYDIKNDDVDAYLAICLYLNKTSNLDEQGKPTLVLTKQELRRLLTMDTSCTRKKMLQLSFALNMSADVTEKFLKDYLAEQGFNYRCADEVIMSFCQSHPEYNSYPHYQRIKAEYERRAAEQTVEAAPVDKNFSMEARLDLTTKVTDEESLYKFMLDNAACIGVPSDTAYNFFMALYDEALADMPERKRNPEQLAKKILQFIPRETIVTVKANGEKKTEGEFVSINDQTTSLPKEIRENMPMRGRLDALINRKKAVERKDLVFFSFFLLMDRLSVSGEKITIKQIKVFIDECNSMLYRCGMSRLHPGNRFENLILISLFSEKPLEMFETIFELSFAGELEGEAAILNKK